MPSTHLLDAADAAIASGLMCRRRHGQKARGSDRTDGRTASHHRMNGAQKGGEQRWYCVQDMVMTTTTVLLLLLSGPSEMHMVKKVYAATRVGGLLLDAVDRKQDQALSSFELDHCGMNCQRHIPLWVRLQQSRLTSLLALLEHDSAAAFGATDRFCKIGQ